MIATMAPRGHFSETIGDARAPTAATSLGVGTTEFGNGTTTVHAQIVATDLGTTPDRIGLRNSDTDVRRATTPAPSRRPAPRSPARRCTRRRSRCATACSAIAARPRADRRRHARARTACAVGGRLRRLRRADRRRPAERRTPRGSPPTAASTASTARSRSTCTPSASRSTSRTGDVRILQSVQAADAGTVMNPAAVPRPGRGRRRAGASAARSTRRS